MSRSVRWGVTVLGCLVVLMFAVVVATGRTSRAVGILHIGASLPSPNDRLLQDAKELAVAGRYEEAHAQLQRLPANTAQRRDAAFILIEGQWADTLFERAARATTSEEKRAILDTLVSESNLDTTRRSKAQDILANLHNNVLAVDELPKTKSARATSSATGAANPNGTGDNGGNSSVANADTQAVTSPANNGRAVQAKSSPTAVSPSPQQRADSSDSSISLELVQERAKKNALRAKVAAGTATDQERRLLRALCRQLNDTSCSR